ncbi:hypothetical protein ACFQE4_21805 [Streptomyces thermocoprophilus]|uniref:hypothetical protein n=1 Tax=Streptomyces thermocoprophilus TaxID=78356 RepID=UPI00360C3E94
MSGCVRRRGWPRRPTGRWRPCCWDGWAASAGGGALFTVVFVGGPALRVEELRSVTGLLRRR